MGFSQLLGCTARASHPYGNRRLQTVNVEPISRDIGSQLGSRPTAGDSGLGTIVDLTCCAAAIFPAFYMVQVLLSRLLFGISGPFYCLLTQPYLKKS